MNYADIENDCLRLQLKTIREILRDSTLDSEEKEMEIRKVLKMKTNI